MKEEKVQKQMTDEFGEFELKLEGLEDGYRVTVRGNPEKVKSQRRVAASFINFLRQAEKAGWRLPRCYRWILRFWSKYNGKKEEK